MKVVRSEFLRNLETVQPGLSPREIVEQSSCFAFKAGKVMTFNDEVACTADSFLGDKFTGAVQAKPLLAILSKLTEETIEIEVDGEEMVLHGKKRKAGIRMEKEVMLPFDAVEKPKDWVKLHEEFIEAVSIVQECAGRDDEEFVRTCVHVAPGWVEANDNTQLSRYKLKTGIKQKSLIRKEAIKHIVTLDMTHLSETETWMHFRNSTSLVLSCRRYIEEYDDIESVLQGQGKPMTIPKGLADAADKASVFSGENADNNLVRIEMRPGKLRIKGVGASGWYSEIKQVKYKGPPISFLISPTLLSEIIKKHNECEIDGSKLRVDGGKWIYVTSLGSPEEFI